MKNYLVKSLFQIKNTNWEVVDRSHEPDLYNNYVAMHELSLASYTKYLQGDWEFKYIHSDCDNINQAFEKTFWAIHDLWHSETCNILYTDPDTIAVKEFNPWNQYDNFMMFNYTDPREFSKPTKYNKTFPHFFNAGVRYFSSTMNKEIWNTGAEMARQWDHSTYDTEQIILNTMLWDQGVDVKNVLDPTVAWQWFGDINYCTQWNQCPISQAKILHLHSSRGAQNRLEVMKQLSRI